MEKAPTPEAATGEQQAEAEPAGETQETQEEKQPEPTGIKTLKNLKMGILKSLINSVLLIRRDKREIIYLGIIFHITCLKHRL